MEHGQAPIAPDSGDDGAAKKLEDELDITCRLALLLGVPIPAEFRSRYHCGSKSWNGDLSREGTTADIGTDRIKYEKGGGVDARPSYWLAWLIQLKEGPMASSREFGDERGVRPYENSRYGSPAFVNPAANGNGYPSLPPKSTNGTHPTAESVPLVVTATRPGDPDRVANAMSTVCDFEGAAVRRVPSFPNTSEQQRHDGSLDRTPARRRKTRTPEVPPGRASSGLVVRPCQQLGGRHACSPLPPTSFSGRQQQWPVKQTEAWTSSGRLPQ